MAHPESLDHMLDAWNEMDSSRVRGHLEKALSPEVEFIDPSVDIRGIDQFEENVRNVHAALPGVAYSRTSGVDSHHGLYHYTWQISRDGEVVLPGFDVTSINEDGKITRVLGFFGPLPEPD